MDGNTPRAEIERWLGISLKLITARDFVASKTFAMRVKESDPGNEMSDQILAVVETVLAGEKRVNSALHPDWYSVLQLPRLIRDADLISLHYRKLVGLLNPERNRIPFADYAFQLVMDAWSILSDPGKKWLFDNELSVFLQGVVDQVSAAGASAASSASVAAAAAPGNGINNQNQVINTFPFFQQQQTPQQPMWQQQQQQQLQLQQQQPSFNYNGNNNNNNNNNQLNQIEFMQQQSPPRQQLQQQQQLLPQWQMRDPNPVKVGERNGNSNRDGNGSGLGSMQVSRPVMMPGPGPGPGMGPRPVPVPVQPEPSVLVPPRVVETINRGMDGNVGGLHVDGNNYVNVNGGVNEGGNVVVEDEVREEEDGIEGFWTSCPYCLYIFEYEKMYQECTLRCQNCRKGFQAVQIPNPPPIVRRGGENGGEKGVEGEEGKKAEFCCWGFFPIGFSSVEWKKNNRRGKPKVPNWVPFSPMFSNPLGNGGGNFELFENGVGAAAVGPKNVGRVRVSEPSIHVVDDDDDFNSDPSEESSDLDWRSKPGVEKKKKKRKRGWGRGKPPKRVIRQVLDVRNEEKISSALDKGKEVSAGGGDLEGGSNAQNYAPGFSAGAKEDSSKKVAATLTRNQARRRVKNMGKLDLNVEFNNEGDEHAPTTSAVNVGEDGVENIEFFEGLDEFLSTLPILNVNENDKAKSS